jgi:hypothetical protein
MPPLNPDVAEAGVRRHLARAKMDGDLETVNCCAVADVRRSCETGAGTARAASL